VKATVKVKSNIRETSRIVRGRIIAGLHAAAPFVEHIAKREVPKDTGNLEQHTRVEVDERNLELDLKSGGPGARHAHLIEYGTIHMEPNPYMRRSGQIVRQPVNRFLAEKL
jgi:HK97 gp10 family phage protein